MVMAASAGNHHDVPGPDSSFKNLTCTYPCLYHLVSFPSLFTCTCNHTIFLSHTLFANMTNNPNPGNFANRPKEEVRAIARKGGQASHSGGFASMDAEKQVKKRVICGSATTKRGTSLCAFAVTDLLSFFRLAPNRLQGWSGFLWKVRSW